MTGLAVVAALLVTSRQLQAPVSAAQIRDLGLEKDAPLPPPAVRDSPGDAT